MKRISLLASVLGIAAAFQGGRQVDIEIPIDRVLNPKCAGCNLGVESAWSQKNSGFSIHISPPSVAVGHGRCNPNQGCAPAEPCNMSGWTVRFSNGGGRAGNAGVTWTWKWPGAKKALSGKLPQKGFSRRLGSFFSGKVPALNCGSSCIFEIRVKGTVVASLRLSCTACEMV